MIESCVFHVHTDGVLLSMLCLSMHVQLALKDPLLYGDYGTALTPDQPRVYQDVQDYDAAKGLFEEVSQHAQF